MRKGAIFIVLALLLMLGAAPVYANGIPPLPQAFYGDVTINDDPAPAGTTIEARGEGVLTGIEGNPITTTESGKYGKAGALEPKLIVQGDILDGATITFWVNGANTEVTTAWHSGITTELDLAITGASITGEVVETIPAGQTNYVVDASAIANTTITVDTIGEVTITVQKYASNPHPGVALPADMVPKYIDIEVDNLDAIVWPMYVEQTYTDAEVVGFDESSLVMYYFKAAAWHECSDTGVNTATNTIWAKMTRSELSGSPVAFGEAVAPEPEPEPEPALPAGGGGGAPPVPPGTTDVRGMVSTTGVFWYSVTAISEDELCTLTIPSGTVGLTEELEPLTEIAMLIMDEPPAPPEDAHVVGLAYDFGPAGATFDPAITLTWSYDPADIPEGVAEEDLVLAYYDEAAGEWVELDCIVDTENNTITASVSHFTTFAIIGAVTPLPAPAAFSVSSLSIQPAEVQPNETITIIVSVANTGGTEGSYSVILKINGVKEEEKSVTVAAGSSEDVSFSVTREEAASYSVVADGLSGSFTIAAPAPLEKPPINWPVLGGIIAGVVAVGLLVFFLVRRRAY